MEKLKGVTSTTLNQELKSILVDVGLIIEFGNWDYKEYLSLQFYEPMSITKNNFICHLFTLDDNEIELILKKL